MFKLTEDKARALCEYVDYINCKIIDEIVEKCNHKKEDADLYKVMGKIAAQSIVSSILFLQNDIDAIANEAECQMEI